MRCGCSRGTGAARTLLTAAPALTVLLVLVCVAGLAPAAVASRPAPPVLDDLRGASASAQALPLWRARAALPAAKQVMAFAAGSVAVSVIFVESDGSIDRDRESWRRSDSRYPGDRRANVLARVQDALTWWNERSPDATLDVFLPAEGEYGAPQTVTTGYEPITRPTSRFAEDYRLSDAGWRWQVMGKLGFGHDADDDKPAPERAYADKVRRKNGADWAFVLYVVDSLKDADGMFPDGAIAYTADLYGPYTVLTYDNDGYGFRNFAAVLAHEMGHQFGALDEYEPPYPGYPSTGGLSSGYLGVKNRNALHGGTTDEACIMRGSQETLDSFAFGDLCASTVGQTGLRVTNQDGRPDVVDTRPAFTPGLPSIAAGGAITLSGAVREEPWPHGKSTVGPVFTRDLSIFVPHDLQYRLDGGEWLPVAAVDGVFDEPSERWTLITGASAAGLHVLQVQGATGVTAGFTLQVTTP